MYTYCLWALNGMELVIGESDIKKKDKEKDVEVEDRGQHVWIFEDYLL